jgi:hypothetical protein
MFDGQGCCKLSKVLQWSLPWHWDTADATDAFATCDRGGSVRGARLGQSLLPLCGLAAPFLAV